MPESSSDLRKEFDGLVSEGNLFFKEVKRDTIGRIAFWYQLSDEQVSRATDIRHRFRCLLARLAAQFQGSPLLDKQDFRKFVRFGRAMDAALHFQAFRNVCMYDSDDRSASAVFNEASQQVAELLDFIPDSQLPETSSSAPEPTGANTPVE